MSGLHFLSRTNKGHRKLAPHNSLPAFPDYALPQGGYTNLAYNGEGGDQMGANRKNTSTKWPVCYQVIYQKQQMCRVLILPTSRKNRNLNSKSRFGKQTNFALNFTIFSKKTQQFK